MLQTLLKRTFVRAWVVIALAAVAPSTAFAQEIVGEECPAGTNFNGAFVAGWFHNTPTGTHRQDGYWPGAPNGGIFYWDNPRDASPEGANTAVVANYAVDEQVGWGLTQIFPRSFELRTRYYTRGVGGAGSTFEQAVASGDFLQYQFTTTSTLNPRTFFRLTGFGVWGGEHFQYGVRVSTDPNFGSYWTITKDEIVEKAGDDGSYDYRRANTSRFPLLRPNTTYYIRAYLYDRWSAKGVTNDATYADDFQIGTAICEAPLLTINKISNIDVGTFDFSGTNGFVSQSITTTVTDTPQAGPVQALAANVATTITEAATDGFSLQSISCTGLPGGTATTTINGRRGGSVLLPASVMVPNANITCTFTNRFVSPHLVATCPASPPGFSDFSFTGAATLGANQNIRFPNVTRLRGEGVDAVLTVTSLQGIASILVTSNGGTLELGFPSGAQTTGDVQSAGMRLEFVRTGTNVAVDLSAELEVQDIDGTDAWNERISVPRSSYNGVRLTPGSDAILSDSDGVIDTFTGTVPVTAGDENGTLKMQLRNRSVVEFSLQRQAETTTAASGAESFLLKGKDFVIDDCPRYDFGDAAASYGDARHNGFDNFKIGADIDAEQSKLSADSADADDASLRDDEDGLVFPARLSPGETINLSVPVTQPAAGVGRLQAWADWDGNGVFNNTSERVANNLPLATGVSGAIALPLAIPAGAVANRPIVLRLRWSSTDDLDATGIAPEGESEDYSLVLTERTELSISKTNTPGVGANPNLDQANDNVISGDATVYTIRIENAGPSHAVGAVVRDTATTPGLSNCTVVAGSCKTSGTATCPSAADLTYDRLSDTSASGGVVIPRINAGASMDFQVSCTVQ